MNDDDNHNAIDCSETDLAQFVISEPIIHKINGEAAEYPFVLFFASSHSNFIDVLSEM